ncbi:MAG TPA: hypothetical protein VMY42_21325 [Thermoguttaceae bacterium]|nr:hypothetical protein [Thermoguttaceae bacterium]
MSRMLWRPSPPIPHVLSPSPTLEEVAQVVNGNSSQIQSLLATGATLSGPGFPRLQTNLAFQRPKRFRLQAELLTSTELDVGSNDDLFWFWVKRNEPPAVYYCRREQFAMSPARQMIPIEPDWLIEALGVVEFDPALPHEGPIALPDGRLEVRTFRETPAGPVTKSTILHAQSGWVLEQRFYDAANRLVARAVASRHQRDPLTGVTLPGVVDISCPLAQFSVRIDLGKVEVNRLSGDPGELWAMPTYHGAPLVDVCDPSLPFPTSMTPPAAVGVRPRPPGRAWQRPMY